jgi:DNA-binding response OmpR family regulator
MLNPIRAENIGGRPLTMLIVEDDPSLLEQMGRFVRKELGMNVRGAEDYYRAILELEQGPVDLASINLRLPRE